MCNAVTEFWMSVATGNVSPEPQSLYLSWRCPSQSQLRGVPVGLTKVCPESGLQALQDNALKNTSHPTPTPFLFLNIKNTCSLSEIVFK